MSKPSDNSQLIRNFSEILGSEQILTDPADRIVYECDGLVLNKRMPDVVVLPRTTEEIAAIVKICNQHDVPYLARGAGTGLSGGAVAYNGGVILQLSRMNQILEIDYDDEIAVVQPGVVNIQLSDLTTEAGYHFAPDPSSQKACTIGGNVAQDTRCWYYRDGWTCYRAGGNICYASPPTAMNREHCILGGSRCVAVNPSDTAPVFVALDAKMVIRRGTSERIVDAEDFFIGPDIDIERMTVLGPGEILTAIRIPSDWAGAQFYFEKVADRNTWDFALVNIASAMFVEGGMISRIRVAAGAVQCVPRRLTVVEEVVVVVGVAKVQYRNDWRKKR